MAAEPNTIDLKDCTITIVDGTSPTPNSIEIVFVEGDLTFSIKLPREYRNNRGKLGTVRNADEEPMDLSFQGDFTKVIAHTSDDIDVSLIEILTFTGAAASWVSTDADNACAPKAVDIIVVRQNDSCGTVMDETITFPNFRAESINGSFKNGTLDVSGKCLALMPTSVRSEIT